MRKRITALFLLGMCLFTSPLPCRAAEILDKQLDLLDLQDINTAIGQSQSAAAQGLNLETLVRQAVQGELTLSPETIMQAAISSLAGEAASLLSMMRHMILLAVLGAIFKELSASFKQKGVSELGFYVHYLVMLSILLSSFGIGLGLVQSLVDELCTFMLAAQPALTGLVTLGGNPTAAFAFAPVLLAAVNAIAFLIQRALIPVITLVALLQIVNYLSERAMLEKLSALLRNGISWALRMTAVLFVAVLSLQRISAPAMNNAVTKTAKLAVNAIPIVGTVLTDTVDTVMVWAGAVRSGVMVAVVIALVVLCAAPLVKLAAFVLIYKATAALIQPISDPRAVKAIDAAGTFAGLLLGAGAVVSIMFIFMVMIMLSV